LIQARDGRKGRLDPRLRPLAFERFDECRLFPGFIGARAAVHVDVAVESAAEDVPAKIAGLVRLLDLSFEDLLNVVELAADVDVGDPGADGIAGDRTAFDEQMRVPLHQHVVLERTGLALVGVAADVLRLR
jgi:hypothetical protein